ncbi:MAG: hypothetical protein KAR40_11305 [Candidatus Sabulitectum sp.]|nr:hypothetical protein [Candidatus Sabulitectum sp.]
MTIKPTSMMAFIGINDDGTAKNLRGQVYRAISDHPNQTRKELSHITGISINSLCGRIHELLTGGAVYESSPRRCAATGRQAAPLSIMVVGKQNTTQVKRRPRIKVLEAQLAIATDALTKIASADGTFANQANWRIAKDALNKINQEK